MSTGPLGRFDLLVKPGPFALCALGVIGALAATSSTAVAQCASWDLEFASRGISNNVYALAWFDSDGPGPQPSQLYAGGEFETAGGARANNVARWDGGSWFALGAGVTGSDTPHVAALAVYDDGSGAALYAAGSFTTAGAAAASNIAKWNGATWSPVGTGTNEWVSALAVYDDGSGAALYAGGLFTTAGGSAASYLAKWKGTGWSSVGGGTNGPVSALAVQPAAALDEPRLTGAGNLFVGGDFDLAGSVSASNVARWNGSTWSSLGGGADDAVLSLAYVTTSAGGGPGLFAGGTFTHAGGLPASRIAKWNGATWSALGTGVAGAARPTSVRSLLVADDGSGESLYVGGRFASAGGLLTARNLARWNGATWSALATGVDGVVRALGAIPIGGGPTSTLIVAGQFASTTTGGASRIAAWNGGGFTPLGVGQGVSGIVRCFAVHDPDGVGPQPTRLFAGGDFKSAGGTNAGSIAMWSGGAWASVGGGTNGPVHAMCVYDDGSGAALYAGGAFTVAGSTSTNHVAKWNGASWSALGTGVDDTVYCLAVFDAGDGPALYAGGIFGNAGGGPARGIARWNGSAWSPLASGIDDEVRALAVFDEGAGNSLYAGGDFTTAGGVACHNIARWNGVSWAALGLGSNGPVHALAVFDDGNGSALYAGGLFTAMNATAADKIARWNGTSWTALTTGVIGGSLAANAALKSSSDGLFALAVYDEDGAGPNPSALYAAGEFQSADGVTANHIAKWSGTSWAPLSHGVDEAVLCLAVHDDGSSASGASLFAGGRFTHTSDPGAEKPTSRVGKWSCP